MKILNIIKGINGVFMYRAYFPSIAIQDFTSHNVKFKSAISTTDVNSLAYINESDLIIFHRIYMQEDLAALDYCKKLGKKTLFDIDDDFFHLNPDNPFKEQVENKPEILAGMIEAIKKVDCVTVTNERLRKIIRKYNHKVKILPNYISQTFFKGTYREQIKKIKGVRLFWSGASNHLDSIKLLIKPLEYIFKNNDNISLVVVDSDYTGLFPFIPRDKLWHFRWENLEKYANAFQHGDIALAPLADNLFNASKSNIRILEAGYHKMPCIASNRYSYAETITHGVNGGLADNEWGWINCLQVLINNEKLIKEMGENAYKMAIENSIEEKYNVYTDFYEEIMNG